MEGFPFLVLIYGVVGHMVAFLTRKMVLKFGTWFLKKVTSFLLCEDEFPSWGEGLSGTLLILHHEHWMMILWGMELCIR